MLLPFYHRIVLLDVIREPRQQAGLPLDSYTSVYSAIKSGNVLDRVNRSSDDNLLMPQYGQKLSTANLDILQNFFDMECSE